MSVWDSRYPASDTTDSTTNSHVTLSSSGLERSVPSELRATQKYSPLSVYLSWDRWSWGLKLSGMLPLSMSEKPTNTHAGEHTYTLPTYTKYCLWETIWRFSEEICILLPQQIIQGPSIHMMCHCYQSTAHIYNTLPEYVQCRVVVLVADHCYMLCCTFEPCKALYRRSCLTTAGQSDRSPLWHLPNRKDCYGGGARTIWRGEWEWEGEKRNIYSMRKE